MRGKILIIYPKVPHFSGQMEAMRILKECLLTQNLEVISIHTPALERSKAIMPAYFLFGARLIKAWVSSAWYSTKKNITIATTGQTLVALIRDGIAIMLSDPFNRGKKIISLHGNVFVSWNKSDITARILRHLANRCDAITVLGKNQAIALEKMGVKREIIHTMDNTCDLSPIDFSSLQAKFTSKSVFKILFLSSLISSKGYPEFIEALTILSRASVLKAHATICGPITPSTFDDRFSSAEEAREWLESKLKTINESPHLSVNWVDGASGDAKRNLFREAMLFVFPSRYKVEAQPIVLLEAMASGCAIISSAAGEIRSTIDDSGEILEDVTPEKIANSIREFVTDKAFAKRRASDAYTLFCNRFSKARYTSRWVNLIESVSGPFH
jgi:glycosyltransferase involved in cell wall biosynthesis